MPPPHSLPAQPLSSTTAHLLGLSFASTYVGSIYVFKQARLIFAKTVSGDATSRGLRAREENEQWRDDPSVIRARLKAVSVATALSLCAVWGLVYLLDEGNKNRSAADTLKITVDLLGLSVSLPKDLQSLRYAILPHLVTPALFLGPLYTSYLARYRWSLRSFFQEKFGNIFGVRNYVVAPLTEELVFRSCILAPFLLSPTLASSPTYMIFVTPLNFGIAHLHHAWDTYNRLGRTAAALKQAIFGSLFQLTYTTLFGAHCAFLFLATHSIFPSLTAHVFCNIMGVPNFAGDFRRGKVVQGVYFLGIAAFTYLVGPWGRWSWCATPQV